MVRLVIDDQQKRLLTTAEGVVELADTSGQVVGFAYRPHPPDPDFTDEEIRAALESLRTNKRWYTTQEVREHLARLATADQPS